MKKLFTILLIIILFVSLSCKKKTDEVVAPVIKNGNIIANVNGVVWSSTNCIWGYSIDGSRTIKGVTEGEKILIHSLSYSPIIRSYFNLNSKSTTNFGGVISEGRSVEFASNDGTFTITSYDSVSTVMSGTFSFVGKDRITNRIVTVSNGVFWDVKYSKLN